MQRRMKNQLFFPTDVRYSLKPIALLIEISNKKHCCFMNLWICFAPVLYPYANEWMLRITFNTTQINEDIYFAHFNLFVRILCIYACWLVFFFYPFLQHFDFLGISHDFASNMIPSGYEHWCCYFLLCSFDSYYMEWLQCSRLKSIRSMYRT